MLKKVRQNGIKVIIIIISIILLIKITEAVILFILIPGKRSAEMILKYDYKSLEIVTNYLENCDDQYIHKYAPYDKIENEEVVHAIKKLFKHQYDAIGKSGNTIYFLRWTRLKDFGAGIAFSIDGEGDLDIDYLIKSEELSKDHWYYFEEN